MKCVLRINAAPDVSGEFTETAAKTCAEFLKLFPNYADKFEIQFVQGNQLSDQDGNEIPFDNTISEEEYSALPYKNRKDYIKQKDRYLIPGESMEWYEQKCKYDKKALNYDKISPIQEQWAKKHLNETPPTRYFHLGITNQGLCDSNGLSGFGISTPEVGTIVSTKKLDTDTFRKLILHEFGHVFKAVHDERNHTSSSEYGLHCTNKGCFVMNADDQPLNEARFFCDECFSSMNNYISKLINDGRTPLEQTNVVDSSQELPPNAELNDEFKQSWRIFANDVATKMGWEYEEDKRDVNFKAKLKATDGSYTLICASSPNNVSLSAKNSTGASAIPDLVVFKELVEKIRKDGSTTVNFGNIKDQEFKARLLIACMEANPPMKAKNAPTLDNDFYAQIERTSAARLKILDNKLKNQNTENNKSPVAHTSNSLVVSEAKKRGGR